MNDSPVAFHVILCTYGFWLPNDPRGSWSTFVRAPNIAPFGSATKVDTRRSVAGRAHDHRQRELAKQALVRPAVEFNGLQARAVGRGFAAQVETSGYVIHACCVMPDHGHLVIRRHRYSIEQVVRSLRQAATLRLLEESLHPFADQRLESGRLPSVWSQGFWKVFLFNGNDVIRSIRYVERNPEKSGLRPQRWPFVVPFDPGANPRCLRVDHALKSAD
ncbi:MAG: transposase [Planctomycetaceae bacterium]